MTKRTITADDLFETKSVTNPVLSPDAASAVFIVTEMNKKENAYYSVLYHVNMQTEEHTRWTFGKERISSPKWSADGTKIAFLSDRSGTHQLYTMQAAGGEARQLTFCTRGIDAFYWSPCGENIWFSGSLRTGETFAQTEEKEEDCPQPVRVTKMKYKADGAGLLAQDEFSQIGSVHLATCAVKNFTAEPFDHSLEAVSHDGTLLVIGVNRSENDDFDFSMPFFIVDTKTKEERLLADAQGYFGSVQFSKDDRCIAYMGADLTYKNATHTALYVYDRTDGTTMNLTASIDAPAGDEIISDHLQQAETPGVVWTDHGLYFQLSVMGDVRLYLATLDGAVYPATGEDEHVYGFDLPENGEFALLAVSTPVNPGELVKHCITTGERKVLTSFNENWLKKVQLSKPQAIQFTNDGFTVHGWLMKPAHFEADKKYPLAVEIHGGPHAMYGNTYFHELQLLAAEYAVLYINPRGSHGYSQPFVDAVRGDYGGGDYRDILAAVDYVLAEESWLDEERIAVTGGSYGGFMTNWIVSHTNRFKAAVTQRSISNWVSFFGVSDIGYYFSDWQHGAGMNDAETLWRHSPLKYAQNIETPLLILHSENDHRCPIEQAEQLFITLKSLRKETEFVRFPESDHNLSRSGRPNLRIARLEEILGWLKRFV